MIIGGANNPSTLSAALQSGNYEPFLRLETISLRSGELEDRRRDTLISAIALRELGYRNKSDWAASETESEKPNAAMFLAELETLSPDGVLDIRAKIESCRIQDQKTAYDVLSVLETNLPDGGAQDKSLGAHLRLARGIAGVNARKLETAVADFEQALAVFRKLDDRRSVAEVQFQYGRFKAWQGREELALPMLQSSLEYWVETNNQVMSAHVRYQLADLWIDRRDFQQAISLLEGVIEDYASVSVAPGQLLRAKQRLGDALIGADHLDDAEALLQQLLAASGSDTFRQQMILKNLGEIALMRAKRGAATLSADQFSKARHFVEQALSLFGDQPARDGFELLTLRGLQGSIAAFDPDNDAQLRLAGVDLIVRSAVGFADAPRERPHEIRLRLAAIDAYLSLLDLDRNDTLGEIKRAITFQLNELQLASGKIGLSLDDSEAQRILTEAQRLVSVPRSGLSEHINSDVSLLDLIGQEFALDLKLEILARLAETLQDQYEIGLEPTAFRPSQVLIKSGGHPVIRTNPQGSSARRISSADQDFMAPEYLAGRDLVVESDLYVIGALALEWMGVSLPKNSGPRFLLRLRRLLSSRRHPSDPMSTKLRKLVKELIDVDPRNRPRDTFSVAARLRAHSEGA